MRAGLVEMRSYLAGRSGAEQSWADGQVLAYMNQVVLASKSAKDIGERNMREMRTLAELLDALMGGNLAKVGDLAMQRFQAIEMAIMQGSWAQARYVEAIPQTDATLANEWVKDAAARGEIRAHKLRGALEKAKRKHTE